MDNESNTELFRKDINIKDLKFIGRFRPKYE